MLFRSDELPTLDTGFVWPTLKWGRGQVISRTLRGTELAPGDFVRWSKQVIDITAQLGAADESMSRTARTASSSLNRGIVAW